MKLTRSGEYRLPGPLYQRCGNLLLRVAPLTPPSVRLRFLARRTFYQVSSPVASGDYQGLSDKKWEAMQMPYDLRGKSVLDIGCSEGFFAQQCARRGAGPVVGIDSSLGRLLTATFIAQRERLRVHYRMGLFPQTQINRSFDYVICLSVIHHSLANKDVWKVLVDSRYEHDRSILKSHLRVLRSLTNPGGRCIVEMPYEYDDPIEERKSVDFDVFANEMVKAGFTTVGRPRTWDYNPDHMTFKDRIIYVAEA